MEFTYKGLAAEMTRHIITDEEVDRQIQRLQQQNRAAGDKAVGHIEHGKYHEVCFDHIHNITKAEAVDHVAHAAAVNGNDQPTLEIGKGPALAGELPNNGCCEQKEHHNEQPLGSLKGGESCACIAHIGQAQ